MYTQIHLYKCNTNSYGNISKQDIDEILDLLNTNKYTHRVNPPCQLNHKLDQIIEEIKNELGDNYTDNCHTLARKVNKELGWDIISGYLVKNQDIGNPNIELIAHSVVQDNNGQLVELTVTWNINYFSFSFITHKSGQLGINLQAS
ncbi:MAG: hypothetical protein QNJ36_10270 [Calothrix sp. MO_167.B42]|nr:hypothetical protein [Calothrix sp. MO_167.B42]